MARTDTLGNFLTDIANAIREKGGTTDTIKASEFDTEIQNLPSGSGAKLFTGHYDTEGLKTIGWSDEEIQYYQDYGVQWNEASDDSFKLTATELARDDSSTTRFLPKNTTKTNFSDYKSLIAIPLINNIISCADMFNSCRSLKAIPQLNTTNVTSMQSMFNDCNSLNSIPQLNTTNVTSMSSMFSNCRSLKAIPQLNTTNVTSMASMFNNCNSLNSISQLDTTNVTSMQSMFSNCYSLNSIPQLNTTNVTSMSSMFNNCNSLKTIPELEGSKATNLNNMFQNCSNLMNFGGLKNIGQSYSTSQSANYTNYTLNLSTCTNLTHDSLMNVINNLYDIKTKGCNPQKLQLGSTNLNKLSQEEKDIATNKGWTLS